MTSKPRAPPAIVLENAAALENENLRGRLEEAEEMIRSIRRGDVDALVIQTLSGPQVYVLQGQDAETNRIRGEMLAHVSDAVIAVDGCDCVTYLNAAAERLYGFAASEALGRVVTEIRETRWHHPDDETAARTALSEQGEWRGENIHVRHDGRELNVESGVTVLRDGQTHGMLAVVRDVTERKLHEHDLMVSEIRYRRLFETAHDGVIVIDPYTRAIVDANPFMTRLLDYSRDELVGKELFEIGFVADAAESQEIVRGLRQFNRIRYDNLPLRSRDGRRQDVEVVANLYEENGQPVIQCNIRDISERKRAEEHVQLLMAEVNHRAKNLLAVVQAVAHQTAKYGDPLTFSARLSDRIDGLAAGQDLLVKSHWQGVDVADLVEAQLAHFKDLFGTRILADGPPARLTAAASQGIGMALHELTTNAAKYGALSNGDGQVRIEWQITAAAKPMFSMSWREAGGPKVMAPTRNGFGKIVIGRMAAAAVDGVVEIGFAENGLAWTLSAPVENALALSERGVSTRPNRDAS